MEKRITMTKERDIDTLARTLYGEARGEDRQGKMAVACVILNRVKKRKMAGYRIIDGVKTPTIDATCLRPWQFSCWNKNDPNREKCLNVTPADAKFVECYNIAMLAVDFLTGSRDDWDIVNGATHYYNPKACAMPRWAVGKKPCAVVGHHLFFNNID